LSIRIYALSKQLNVDSKEILDAIKHLGIEGKGSSLAGLTEEEVEQIKDKLNVHKKTKTPQPGSAAFQRPVTSSDKKVLNLDAHAKPAAPYAAPQSAKPDIADKAPDSVEPVVEATETVAPPDLSPSPPVADAIPEPTPEQAEKV
jgi:translation initiation factor IF-2